MLVAPIKPIYKGVYLIVSLVLFGLTFYAGLAFLRESDVYKLLLWCVPATLFILYLLGYTFATKLVLTDNYVERRGLRPVQIAIDRIERVNVYVGELEVWSRESRIKVTKDFQDHQVLVNQLVSRLKGQVHVKFGGDQTLVDKIQATR